MSLDCYELSLQKDYSPGVQEIQIDGELVTVECTIDGWTVIQSRGQFGNSADFFYKNWESYKTGFGEAG